jgi:Domain of unknown function (DUF427)
MPPEDVRMDLMVPSEKITACPYKGNARHYSVKVGDRLFKTSPGAIRIDRGMAQDQSLSGFLSGTVAAFSCQSIDHGVTGRETEKPSTRISSTCSVDRWFVPSRRNPRLDGRLAYDAGVDRTDISAPPLTWRLA